MAYQNINGGGIGTLLRMIAEEKTKTPLVSPSAEAGSPQRELIQEPVLGAESPGSERMVSIQPEDVTAPVKPESAMMGASRVGPLAIGGEDVTAMQPPQPSIPGKGDINVETGRKFAENPNRNWAWDDNYWANEVEPRLKSGWRPGGQQNQPQQPQPDFSQSQQAAQSAQPKGQTIGTQISYPNEPPLERPYGPFPWEYDVMADVKKADEAILNRPPTAQEAKAFGEQFRKSQGLTGVPAAQITPRPSPTPTPAPQQTSSSNFRLPTWILNLIRR